MGFRLGFTMTFLIEIIILIIIIIIIIIIQFIKEVTIKTYVLHKNPDGPFTDLGRSDPQGGGIDNNNIKQ